MATSSTNPFSSSSNLLASPSPQMKASGTFFPSTPRMLQTQPSFSSSSFYVPASTSGTAKHGLRLLCGTWNVNASVPGGDSLMDWLGRSETPPDLVALAFQEMVDLKDLTQYIHSKDSERAVASWGDVVLSTLRSRYRGTSFTMVRSGSLVGVGISVIARTRVLKCLKDIRWSEVATGAFGVVGNKGACGVSFKVVHDEGKETSMCFVAMHLSAHQSEVARRNQDWENVLTKMLFYKDSKGNVSRRRRRSSAAVLQSNSIFADLDDFGDFPLLDGDGPTSRASLAPMEEFCTVFQHDELICMGDLNYRVEEEYIEALRLLRAKDIRSLLARDQLTQTIRYPPFSSFKEAPINFAPTYKFETGTSRYENRPGKKKRTPSWCDRVLFRLTSPNAVCVAYFSCMSILASDHKPVAAHFSFPDIMLSGNEPGDLGSGSSATSANRLGRRNDPALSEDPSQILEGGSFVAPPNFDEYVVDPEASMLHQDFPGAANSNTTSRIVAQVVYAKERFVSNFSDELGLEEGDLIEIIGSDETGAAAPAATSVPLNGLEADSWCVGLASDGRVGYFPTKAVRVVGAFESSRTPEAAVLATKAGAARKARLAAQAGSAAKPSASSSGSGKRSILPVTEGEDERAAPKPAEPPGPPTVFTRARFAFQARSPDELSFDRGEVLEILSTQSQEEGWWIARARERQGLVPANHFQAKAGPPKPVSAPPSSSTS